MRRGGKKIYLNWKFWLSMLVVLVVLYISWYFLLSYEDCGADRDCFDFNLGTCTRSKYIGGTDMIYEYIVMGTKGEDCNVQVRLIQGELNNQDSKRLEGKEMICSLPRGIVMNPESDIVNCHGPLKEGLQDLIIQKLHNYLVKNLGRINLEVLDLPTNVGESEEQEIEGK